MSDNHMVGNNKNLNTIIPTLESTQNSYPHESMLTINPFDTELFICLYRADQINFREGTVLELLRINTNQKTPKQTILTTLNLTLMPLSL